MNRSISALIVEDDPVYGEVICQQLRSIGFLPTKVGDITSYERVARRCEENGYHFDVVLLDLWLGKESSIQLIRPILRSFPKTRIFVLTAQGTIPDAVKALKQGATGFFEKHVTEEALRKELSALIAERDVPLPADLIENIRQVGIVGRSAPANSLFRFVHRLRQVDTVLINGSTGSGKELIAKLLHKTSDRRDKVFEAVNCASIPESLIEAQLFGVRRGAYTDAKVDRAGLFETCTEGTLFLDEIGEIPISLQAKLLRAIQNREIMPVGATRAVKVQTKIIAATNKDLQEEVVAKRFREDLYYRLNAFTIDVPTLDERRDDIPDLVEYFARKFCTNKNLEYKGASPALLMQLQARTWPGNIRQLQGFIEKAVVFSDTGYLDENALEFLDAKSGAAHGSGPVTFNSLSDSIDSETRVYICSLLTTTKGNVKQASQLAGRNRVAFYKLLKKHAIDPSQFRTSTSAHDSHPHIS